MSGDDFDHADFMDYVDFAEIDPGHFWVDPIEAAVAEAIEADFARLREWMAEGDAANPGILW